MRPMSELCAASHTKGAQTVRKAGFLGCRHCSGHMFPKGTTCFQHFAPVCSGFVALWLPSNSGSLQDLMVQFFTIHLHSSCQLPVENFANVLLNQETALLLAAGRFHGHSDTERSDSQRLAVVNKITLNHRRVGYCVWQGPLFCCQMEAGHGRCLAGAASTRRSVTSMKSFSVCYHGTWPQALQGLRYFSMNSQMAPDLETLGDVGCGDVFSLQTCFKLAVHTQLPAATVCNRGPGIKVENKAGGGTATKRFPPKTTCRVLKNLPVLVGGSDAPDISSAACFLSAVLSLSINPA